MRDSSFQDISLSEVYEYDTHIVAAFALSSIHIRGQQRIEKTLGDLAELDLALHLDVDVVNNLLTRFRLPDAVAAHDGEVCL